MDEIKRQVARARRRLIAQQFLRIANWTVFGGMLVSVVALAISRIWVLQITSTETSGQLWTWSWIAGGLCVGLLLALAWTYCVRRGEMDAACEIDRRFGLKERVSTALSLRPEELDGGAGRALLDDTKKRIETIDVDERFRLSANWQSALPLIPALVAFVLALFVDSALPEQIAASTEQTLEIQQRVQTSESQFQDKLAKMRKDLEDKGLKDAAAWFKELEQQYENAASKGNATRKQALVRLNNVKEKVEARKNDLSKTDALQKQLSQLKDFKKGPADEAINAMRNGNFGQATDEAKKLAEKLRNDELRGDQKDDLQDQIEQLQEQLAAHQNAKEQLRQQIEQAENEGNQAKAEQLKKDLERLEKQDLDMQQLRQLAKQLEALDDSLKNGDLQQAANDLEQLADEFQNLQNQLDALKTLDQSLDQIAQAKSQMNCQQCQGAGCAACNGQGQGQRDQLVKSSGARVPGGQGQGQNNDTRAVGLGEGEGEGARPEQETDTGHFLSKVDTDPQRGEVERIGEADGPNASGVTREQAKETVKSRMSKAPDPVVEQSLPRDQRDHVKEYFELFTKPGE